MRTKRFRLPGTASIVSIVDDDLIDSTWPGLVDGSVWVRPERGDRLMAAPRAALVAVGEHRDLRTVSGGLTVSHGVVSDWVEQGETCDIPVLEFWSRGPVKLRPSDVAELLHILAAMQAEMPPDPLMRSGSLLS